MWAEGEEGAGMAMEGVGGQGEEVQDVAEVEEGQVVACQLKTEIEFSICKLKKKHELQVLWCCFIHNNTLLQNSVLIFQVSSIYHVTQM